MPLPRVAAHPGLNHGDFSRQPFLNPLLPVRQLARTLVLHPNLHNLLGRFCSGPARHHLRNIPGHRLLGIEILAGGQCRQKVLGMQMLRRRLNHRVNIIPVQQPHRVIVGGDIRHKTFHLVAPARIYIGHCNALHIRLSQCALQVFLTAISGANNSNADAIIRANHPARGEQLLAGKGPQGRNPQPHLPHKVATIDLFLLFFHWYFLLCKTYMATALVQAS